MVKFVGSALVALALILGPQEAPAANLKIGVVDTNAILSSSAEGKRAQDAIKKKAEELSRPLGTKRQDLARQMEEFQKKAGMMKEEARQAKAKELEKKMADFDKQAQDADKQLSKFRETTLSPISKKMDQALEQVSKQENLDMILDKSVVLISNKSLDVTDKVRSKFGR